MYCRTARTPCNEDAPRLLCCQQTPAGDSRNSHGSMSRLWHHDTGGPCASERAALDNMQTTRLAICMASQLALPPVLIRECRDRGNILRVEMLPTQVPPSGVTSLVQVAASAARQCLASAVRRLERLSGYEPRSIDQLP